MSTETQHLDWDDVAGAVKPIIETWVCGSELRWAEHAWNTLRQAGLANYSSELERTRCLLRAAALAVLYLEFCARAFEEGAPDDWREKIGGDLIGVYPLIDTFTLGQLVEREGIEVDDSPLGDGREVAEALRNLVDAEYPGVAKLLRGRWGDDELFAALFVSREADVQYPLDDERVSNIVNTDITASKMAAWEWLTDGSPFDP